MEAQRRTKVQKTRDWVMFHAPELIVTSIVTVTLSGFAYLAYSKLKTEKSEADKFVEEWNAHADVMNDWIAEEQAAGNAIYALVEPDTYLVVPESAQAQFVQK